MMKPRPRSEALAYLAYLAACRRDLLDGAAKSDYEIEEARKQYKAAKLDRFVARKRAGKLRALTSTRARKEKAPRGRPSAGTRE